VNLTMPLRETRVSAESLTLDEWDDDTAEPNRLASGLRLVESESRGRIC